MQVLDLRPPVPPAQWETPMVNSEPPKEPLEQPIANFVTDSTFHFNFVLTSF